MALKSKKEELSSKSLSLYKQKKKKSKDYLAHFSKIILALIFLQLVQASQDVPFSFALKETINFPMKSHSNESTIKISGIGEQYVVSEIFYKNPDLIYLNGNTNPIEPNNRTINLPSNSEEINTLKLIWNDKLLSLHLMFENLTNITEVDLSRLDSSSVTHMTQMFWNCSSLTSINFANFDSSSVQDMHLTFAGCIDLKELDLSTFDTSKVTTMYYMFTD